MMDVIESDIVNPDNFCLKWSNYQAHVLGVLVQLLEAESLVDVTLCTSSGDKLHAHKIVLCAASSYFEEIFADSNESHPIVILSEIETEVLRCILDFVYHGELNVHATQLTEVLHVAAALQIRGLTEVSDQLPQLVPSNIEGEHAPPLADGCINPGNHEELFPVHETSTNEVVVAPFCCDADTQTVQVAEFDYENSTALQKVPLDGNKGNSIEDSNERKNNQPHYNNTSSDAFKENCNQDENWPIDASFVDEDVGDFKKHKRRESCRKEYSEEQLAAALRDLKSGQLLRETASAHNIPRSTLYVRAKAVGIPITVTRQEHSGENVNAAVQAVNEGASLQQASEMYQIPKTVLWRRVRAAGTSGLRITPKRQSYGPIHWQAAVQALQDGQNLSKVSAQFQIPKTTLFREKERLVEAGKLPWSCLKKRDPQSHSIKHSRLKEAVAACQEGKMSQAVASITYQVPKTTIWRRLQKGTHQTSDAMVKSVRSVEVTDAAVENTAGAVHGTLQEQTQFTFIEGNGQLPVTYIVEEDFSAASLIM